MARKLKKGSIAWHKDKAWKQFSKYIRLRDCLSTMGSQDEGMCYTCDRVYPFKSLQAGHFVDGRTASILFDENLVNAQCYSCNVMKSGNKDSYTPKMIHKWGLERVEQMWRQKNKVHQWTREELDDIRKNYKEEFEFIRDNN